MSEVVKEFEVKKVIKNRNKATTKLARRPAAIEDNMPGHTRTKSFLDEVSGNHYEYDEQTGATGWLATIRILSHHSPGSTVLVSIPNGAQQVNFTVPYFLSIGDILLINATGSIVKRNGEDYVPPTQPAAPPLPTVKPQAPAPSGPPPIERSRASSSAPPSIGRGTGSWGAPVMAPAIMAFEVKTVDAHDTDAYRDSLMMDPGEVLPLDREVFTPEYLEENQTLYQADWNISNCSCGGKNQEHVSTSNGRKPNIEIQVQTHHVEIIQRTDLLPGCLSNNCCSFCRCESEQTTNISTSALHAIVSSQKKVGCCKFNGKFFVLLISFFLTSMLPPFFLSIHYNIISLSTFQALIFRIICYGSFAGVAPAITLNTRKDLNKRLGIKYICFYTSSRLDSF